MSPKNRKVDDSAGDDVADDDASEDDTFEDATDDDSLDDDYQDEDEDYEDEDDYEEDAEDDDELDDEPPARETPAEKRKRMDNIRASTMAADIEPGQSSVSTKWAIDRLDAREKRFSFIAAGGAALFATIIYLVETQNHNFRLAKGQITPQTTLVVGLIAAALLIATTVLGRRAPVGFVALFTGAAFGGSYLFLGLPFFVLAIWLLYRSYKLQKETTARLREAGVGPRARPSPTARPAKAARPAASSRPTTVAEARRARSKKSSAPVGNKRYTPKRPAPPAPKPSRRQRKAAAAD
jgi:hypothetical protein